MDIEEEIKRFKMQLLRKMPFYGDIIMRLPIISNPRIPTAQTNGRRIEYNPKFLAKMSTGQRNFVVMHEVFHVLLFHCERKNERLPQVWNVAADMIVNSMLMNLYTDMRRASIEFERPSDGIFLAYLNPSETVENLYAKLLEINRDLKQNSSKIKIFRYSIGSSQQITIEAPNDIILVQGDSEGSGEISSESRNDDTGTDNGGNDQDDLFDNMGLSRQALLQIVKDAVSKNRSSMGSYYVPGEIFGPVETKKIKWQSLLRDFLTDETSEEVSYATPERKYIHMGLIIPGYGSREEKIEEIWAFVDSSGSVGNNEMSQFLTQLYRIAKEFKCIFNICYWDTEVTDVYMKIERENKIFESIPHHSGGTNINCVYSWIKENNIRPDVMLILTDGYFGALNNGVFIPSLAKKTILVLSGNIPVCEDMRRMGRIARL